MKKLMIAAATLLAAMAAPGLAAAKSGYVGLSYSNGNIDGGGTDIDVDTIAGEGVVAFDAGALGVQLDVSVGNIDVDNAGDADFYQLGGHLYSRGQKWLVGGFASYTNVDADGADADAWTVGAETQYYFARTTVSGALSYAEIDDADVDGWFIDGEARHFYTDNFSASLGLGYGAVDVAGTDADLWTIGVGAEYQFASAPVSVYGAYDHSEIEIDAAGSPDGDVDAFTLGVRWNFGGGSLFDRDRNGAGLATRGMGDRLFGLF